MSFLTDLLEGNFGNLGTDIADAPSSLLAHPEQIAELAGAVALPFAAPEIAGALGLGDVLGLGGDLTGSAAAEALGGAGAIGEEAVPTALTDASLASLGGDLVGGDALSFAPTAADFASPVSDIGALGAGSSAAGGGTGLVGAVTPEVSSGALASPTEILSADPAVSQALDVAPTDVSTAGAEGLSGPSTTQFASAAEGDVPGVAPGAAAVHTADVPAAGTTLASDATTGGAASVGGAPQSEILASSDVPALGGQAGAEDLGSAAASGTDFAAQSARAAAGAPSGFGGVLSSLGSIASNPLAQMAIPGGFLAYNLLKGPPGIPSNAQVALNNAQANVGPLQQQATKDLSLFQQTTEQDLNLANNFQVSPSQAAQLSTFKQDAYNQLLQQIANQNPGADPKQSSQWILGKQQIDEQVLGQQTQMINQLITTAFQSASAANAAVSTSANVTAQYDSLLMQAAQLQVQQDASFNQAVGMALQSFGLIAGLNAGKFAKAA